MTRERQYRRRAAGRVMFAAFHACNAVANSMLVFNHIEWGDDLLTDNERLYLAKTRARIHTDGEMCRKLGERLCR